MDDRHHIRQPPALPELIRRSAAIGFHMACEDQTGALLRTLAASKPGGRFLELGTGTGISAAWLLDGMDRDSRLVSVELEERHNSIARQMLDSDPRVRFVTADANPYLTSLGDEQFDLIFADCIIGKFENIDRALAAVAPGGFYIGDDLLPQSNWPSNHQLRVDRFVEDFAGRAGFCFTRLAWASGLLIAVRKAPASLS